MWIKATLKAKGFKLKDMAEALGITAPRVTDILRGTREVQTDELEELAVLLGLNLKSLLASLEAGALTEIPDNDNNLPVLGYLMGDGNLKPLSSTETVTHVAVPPDAESTDGLYCYIMGDNSMAQEIKSGDIIIAADPRMHFYPMVPGALFLVACGANKLALRQFVQSDSGENWLVPLPEHPDPKLASWRYRMLPPSLSEAPSTAPVNETEDAEKQNPFAIDTDTEIQAGETLHIGRIAAAVLWVHRRYRPQEGAE